MAHNEESDKPTRSKRRRKGVVVRVLVALVVVAAIAFRIYSYNQEWSHHQEKGYETGAAFCEDLLKKRFDAAYGSTTDNFKERWSRDQLEQFAAEVTPENRYLKGFHIQGGLLSSFLRGHLKTEYPIRLKTKDNKHRKLRLAIVEKDAVLRVDGMEVVEDGEE